MAEQKRQWKGKTGGGAFGQWFLFKMLSCIPVRVMYYGMYIALPFYALFDPKSFKNTKKYFIDHHHYTPKQARRAAWRNYKLFGQVVMDKFAFMAQSTSQFRIDVINREHFDELLQSDKGIFVLSGHVGNFELAGHCLKQDQKMVNYVAYSGESATFKRHRQQSSENKNINIIPVLPDMSHLFTIKEVIDNGEIVAIPCDRLWGSNRKMTFDFLGAPADFPLGTFRVACQLEAQVCALFVMKVKDTHYRAYVMPMTIDKNLPAKEQPKDLAEQYVRQLEKILQEYPDQWFNYYPFWNKQA